MLHGTQFNALTPVTYILSAAAQDALLWAARGLDARARPTQTSRCSPQRMELGGRGGGSAWADRLNGAVKTKIESLVIANGYIDNIAFMI